MTTKKIIFLLIMSFLIEGLSSLNAQNRVTVHPQEYPDAFRNPLKGFRANLNQARNADYPYTSIVRHYIKWNEIENSASDGVQEILDFCNEKWAVIEEINIKVIPRVYIDWDKREGNEFWPKDLENYIKHDLGKETWDETLWNDPVIKERLVQLVYKLGEAWDNDPRVAWIQTGLIGYWGEQEKPVGVHEDGWAKMLGEAYSKAFANKKLIVRNQRHWDTEGYEWGVYWDSYGHPGQRNGAWQNIQNTNATSRYKTQIVEGEVAYDWGLHLLEPLYGVKPEITLNNYQYTNNMIDVIKELHCTGLGWISSYKLDGSNNTNPDSVRANAGRMQKEFGYRFIIPEFSCSSRADRGGNLEIIFKVKNVGSAPFYEDWPLAFVLIDETTQEIVWKEILHDIDIRNWLPGDNYSYTSRRYETPAQEYVINKIVTIPGEIAIGQYLAGITILEPHSQTPGVFFAIKNFLAKSQTQPLSRIGIGEDLKGIYEIDPTIFGDPLVDDKRFYSLTPQR